MLLDCRRVQVVASATAFGCCLASTSPIATAAGVVDVVGIRVGMPLKEAAETLKVHNPRIDWRPNQVEFDLIPGVTFTTAIYGQENARYKGALFQREKIVVESMPGPPPAVVTGVYRALNLEGDEVTTFESVMQSLEKKYGKPATKLGSADSWMWQFNSDGQPFMPTSQCNPNVFGRGNNSFGIGGASQYVRSEIAKIPNLVEWTPNCRSFVWVVIRRSTSNNALVTGITTYASDEVLRTARIQATAKTLQQRSDANSKKEKQEASARPAPKF